MYLSEHKPYRLEPFVELIARPRKQPKTTEAAAADGDWACYIIAEANRDMYTQ